MPLSHARARVDGSGVRVGVATKRERPDQERGPGGVPAGRQSRPAPAQRAGASRIGPSPRPAFTRRRPGVPGWGGRAPGGDKPPQCLARTPRVAAGRRGPGASILTRRRGEGDRRRRKEAGKRDGGGDPDSTPERVPAAPVPGQTSSGGRAIAGLGQARDARGRSASASEAQEGRRGRKVGAVTAPTGHNEVRAMGVRMWSLIKSVP